MSMLVPAILSAIVLLVPALAPRAAAQVTDAAQSLTVAQSANPELVGHLAKELNITAHQAQGGAGALLGLAKNRLKPEEFSKISDGLPGIEGLLKAAPAVTGGGGGLLGGLGGGGGALGGLASLAGSFKSLGLSPEMALKMAPALINFVKGKGLAEAAGLLGGILK
jgi:hypothetical protein